MGRVEVATTRHAVETSQASDDDLLAAVRDGDDRALRALLARYRPFARARARSYFLIGGDRDDVVQEGMIGLYKAVRDYDPDREASFRTFAELCINRQILSAIKAANRNKHAPLNAYVSFDTSEGNECGNTLREVVAVDDDEDPLVAVLDSDEMRELRRTIRELLSELESDVLDLYVQGRSYEEIAEVLGRHTKSVDNALQRVKQKLMQQLRDGDGSLIAS